jgi:flavin reductase (DIM6/NTAB) family NADH-FMN oxidoreductase RutF
MKVEVPLSRANRLINPGPVVLLTAGYEERTNVMPAAWAVPLSKTPPQVGVAVHPARYTHELIERSRQFALNVPGRALAEAVARLGSVSGHQVADKFALAGLTLAEPEATNAPLIEDCLAWLECAVVDTFRVGDHTLFVGEVLAARAEREAFGNTWLLTDDSTMKPLHHMGSNLFAVLEGSFEVS